jgi:hypothetical protein
VVGNNSHFVNRFVDRDMMMRYRGGGVGHKSTRNATNVFLRDRDPLDYPADQPNPLHYDEDSIPDQPYIDDAALELSDDEEALRAKNELDQDMEEEEETENQYDLEDVDGRLTTEEELGFSPL